MTESPTTPSPLNASTVAERVAAVRKRIAQACERADRDPARVRLVAVSKTHDVDALREVCAAGVVDFGENRAQELVPKARAVEAAAISADGGEPFAWHFIGHLQRNKVREVMPHVSVLHSVDSPRLIDEIARRRPDAIAGRGMARATGALPCYLEVNVGGEAEKHGIAPADLPALLAAASACRAIRVSGLMTVAPQTPDPEAARPVFRSLRELAHAHGLDGLSMGMTDDFEVAIEEGATVVRVGRAIFGARNG